MKRRFKFAGLIVGACAAGIATGELVVRAPLCRDALGRMFGQGDLIAIVHGRGFYQASLTNGTRVEGLVVAENIRWLSRDEPVATAARDRAYHLLESQFGNEKAFAVALEPNGFSFRSLRATIDEHLRAERWIDKQIAPKTVISDEECRQFFNAHHDAFNQPVRYRASHLFLAAPAETPADVVETKRLLIEFFANQVAQHVDLSELATQFSEDEATKPDGGDLGFFSVSRVPSDFFSEVAKLRVGETSKPFRSHLGFHIVQLTDMRPSREMSFEEARAGIAATLEALKRRAAVELLTAGLKTADFRRPPG
jgi:PPIC-type PPIASE domain